MAFDGILNIDKPAGMTSHDVVAKVRRTLRMKRVGHAGTLDPDATGVLVVAVGSATRLLPYLPVEPKEYVARIVFGLATTTEDASGQPIAEADASSLTESVLRDALPRFRGEIDQVPPMVSALHHEGKRLYELARQGIVVEREPRRVMIHDLRLSDFLPGVRAEATLRVRCGGGTYIRTLCVDLGAAVGLPAHMGTLRREAVGRFHRQDAITLEAFTGSDSPERAAAHILPAEQALDFPAVAISDDDARQITRGQAITALTPSPASEVIMLLYRERLLALAHHKDESLHPFRVFSGPLEKEETEE